MQRGYGRSHGNWSEGYGSCYNLDHVKAELANSHDMLADPAYFAGQGFVDPKRVVLIAQSSGGLRSVATDSRNTPGDVGFVYFSGGR